MTNTIKVGNGQSVELKLQGGLAIKIVADCSGQPTKKATPTTGGDGNARDIIDSIYRGDGTGTTTSYAINLGGGASLLVSEDIAESLADAGLHETLPDMRVDHSVVIVPNESALDMTSPVLSAALDSAHVLDVEVVSGDV